MIKPFEYEYIYLNTSSLARDLNYKTMLIKEKNRYILIPVLTLYVGENIDIDNPNEDEEYKYFIFNSETYQFEAIRKKNIIDYIKNGEFIIVKGKANILG